jgi:hypothetical protein
MGWFLFYVALTALVCFVVVWFIHRGRLHRTEKENADLREEQPKLQKKYERMFEVANEQIAVQLQDAELQRSSIIQNARAEAEQIRLATKKLEDEADVYQQTVIAMKNIIAGYGDEYLVPTSTLLDDLAEEFSHKEAGKELKDARKRTRAIVKEGRSAECDYVEDNRRVGAINFVTDAFNGKVDTVMSKVKHDNYGKLAQAIHDAFIQVNFSGVAFRNARVTEMYKQARLDELRWACIAQELRLQEREEQRLIREQIREEEKARREYQKAIQEAEKEERMLKKAMEKARKQFELASAEQRVLMEAQLAEMEARLHEAEEKNQRATSMAQLTKRGHVYIISNVGSFGDNVYKIGLTRRLEPLDRVKELGDASVPFAFDVHAMIMSDDAPALERELHNHFLLKQINKVNHRKEFFRASLQEIREELESMGVETKWTMVAEAAEYRESLAIERMIDENPEAKAAWESRQLSLDPTEYADIEIE